ncbi:MAG: hypothetical protein D6800_05355 [Candidatus Zixiibacteriota bacterium]|nr:MAG: hypothetical protein D6800_05355 [candidate division Zixibacteria bacterium]
MNRYWRLCIVLLWLGLPASGCFYSFNPGGRSEIKSIAVERFDDNTGQFGLADRLTDIVIDEFIADGNLKVVSAANADAVLQGTLTRYERLPQVFDENDRVQQYKIRLTFEMSLKKVSDGSEYWKEVMTPEGIYDANSEVEEDGQRRAAAALVEAVLNKTTKSW